MFSILFLNSPICSNFLTFGGDSVDEESHSSSTESTPSETLRQLSQRRVRLHVDSVGGESDSASTQCEGDDSCQNRHK
jgi:hypothetical protein